MTPLSAPYPLHAIAPGRWIIRRPVPMVMETLDDFITMTEASVASSPVGIPAAVLAMMLARALTDGQESRGVAEAAKPA